MNNILASKVLMLHLKEITDSAYKKATEIAIETLLSDAVSDWHKSNSKLSLMEHLEMNEEECRYWLLGERSEQFING